MGAGDTQVYKVSAEAHGGLRVSNTLDLAVCPEDLQPHTERRFCGAEKLESQGASKFGRLPGPCT